MTAVFIFTSPVIIYYENDETYMYMELLFAFN